ncbi:MAG: hypothetical protein K5989_11015, partial [Lachnospiraceae bacterium]|nr:hypothetical protein [Lachnospiraceae bacterium]
VSDTKVSALKQIYQLYNNESINQNLSGSRTGQWYNGFLVALRRGIVPVWYNSTTKKMSLAAIGRILYDKSLDILMDKKMPCVDRKHLCKACSLFGMVGSKEAAGSHIRVSDAKKIEGNQIDPSPILRELASPKISYIPFYTHNENGKNTWDYDSNGTSLLGRKYYWHYNKKDSWKVKVLPGDEKKGKTERNATMELMDIGTQFDFDIYYDKITDEQLEELIWILTLGQNYQDSNLCHKLGHGKPIGLGSIKIVINKNICRTLDTEKGVIVSENSVANSVSFPKSLGNIKNEPIKSLLSVLDFNIVKGEVVSYPFIENAKANDNETAPHRWFQKNWDVKKGQDQEWRKIESAIAEPFFAYSSELDEKVLIERDQNEKEEVAGQHAIVIGYNKKKTSIKVEFIGSKKSIFIVRNNIHIPNIGEKPLDETLPLNTKIEIKYGGEKTIDGAVREIWTCESIITNEK